MIIQWYGHACFRLQAQQQEASLVIDPFGASIGIRPPKLTADIVVITTDTPEHNNSDAIKKSEQEPFCMDHPGEYEMRGVFLQGKAVHHEERETWTSIWAIKMDEIIVGHLGSMNRVLNEAELDFLGKIDVLLLPVGNHDTLTAKQAVEVLGEVEPRIIIPMCYRIPGIQDYQPLEMFLKEYGLKDVERVDKIKIIKKDLPAEKNQVIVLNAM